MPARTGATAAAATLTAVLAVYLTVGAASCPPANGRDAAVCDTPHRTGSTTSLCAADAQQIETCADHAAGLEHALYQVRAASEWRKAALAADRRTARARRWLAHAMVLDERVQDEPVAPPALRAQAKRNEELARTALLTR